MKSRVILLVGESGSGKSELENSLRELGFNCIESYTTREPRFKGERGHKFVDKAAYDHTIDIVAETIFDNNYYWTTQADFTQEGTSIYIVDIQGVKDCIINLPTDTEIYTVYLKTSTITRLNRMTEQGRSYEDIIRRLRHDEISFKPRKYMEFDKVIDANKCKDLVLIDMLQFIRRLG